MLVVSTHMTRIFGRDLPVLISWTTLDATNRFSFRAFGINQVFLVWFHTLSFFAIVFTFCLLRVCLCFWMYELCLYFYDLCFGFCVNLFFLNCLCFFLMSIIVSHAIIWIVIRLAIFWVSCWIDWTRFVVSFVRWLHLFVQWTRMISLYILEAISWSL